MKFAHISEQPPEGADAPPQAHHYEVGFCGHCPNIHIMFFDESGRGLAQAILTEAQIVSLLSQITDNQLDSEEL